MSELRRLRFQSATGAYIEVQDDVPLTQTGGMQMQCNATPMGDRGIEPTSQCFYMAEAELLGG